MRSLHSTPARGLGLGALLAALGCGAAPPPEEVTSIDAAEWFPLEPGSMWQFHVEGGGDELGYTFFTLGEAELLEGGLSALPLTIAAGPDEREAVPSVILLLQTGGGWINLVGTRGVTDGTDQLFDAPAALGRAPWAEGESVSTTVSNTESGSFTVTATLEEIADRQVYYGTFADAARVTLYDGGGGALPIAGEWWWGHGIGPIRYASTAEGAFALELVYYE